MKRITMIIFVMTVCILSYACTKNRLEDHVTLRFGYASSTDSLQQAFNDFSRRIEEKTHGQIKVLHFPNSQLGGERELVELAQTGAIDITKVSGGLLESFSSVYGVFSTPFLFDNEAHFYQVMDDGGIMSPVYRSTEAIGIVALTYYDSGQRSFYTKNKPIRTLEDIKGLKIRVMQSQTAIRMVSLLGGSPVAMSNNETYAAIQQGIIDGAESNEMALTIPRHGEVAKAYSYDMHTRIPDILIINANVLNQLSPAHRQAVIEAAKESTELQKILWRKEVEQAKQQAQNEFNVQFYDVDVKAFQNAVSPMYAEMREKHPEQYALYERIKQAATAGRSS
jgi:tripartite ATP-independent transporter DctP family solute receptor